MKNDIALVPSVGRIIWLYGRPCAGKTTIADDMADKLKQQMNPVITLDGDELREGMNADLGFSPEDRHENIRRTAELAKFLAMKGFDVICSLVTPTRTLRSQIRELASGFDLWLVYVDTPLEMCIRRDVKGHYQKACSGQLDDFTGIGSPFELPSAEDDDLIVPTLDYTVAQCAQMILEHKEITKTNPKQTKHEKATLHSFDY
jgi:adenylyl-sulfate kinase